MTFQIPIPTTVDDPTMTLIYILIVIISTTIITRIIRHLINKMERFEKDMTAAYLMSDIITYICYFISLLIILQFFGIDLAGTLLSVGIVGIAVTFAAKDILSNLFSGIILIIGKSIKVGDTIEIDGEKGIVESVSLRTTVITDDTGVKNQVPNSILTNNPYLQFKPNENNRADIIVGLPLTIDIEDFSKQIINKMKSYDKIAKNPSPNVFAKEIKFEECRLKISFWVKNFNDKDQYKIIIINEIRKLIKNMGENNE